MAGAEYDFREKSHAGKLERPEAPKGKSGAHVLGHLRRMEIEPAENGVTVTHMHEPPRGNGKGPEPHYTPPKPFVFTSHEEAGKHIIHHLAHHAAGHMMNSDGSYDEALPKAAKEKE
jgi:hypothetical protein